MHTKPLMITFIFVLLLTPPALLAQDSKNQTDWSAVQAVSIGVKLRIESKSGEHTEGTLRDITDSALTVNRKGKAVTVSRTDIRKVYSVESKSRTKPILIGTAIGAGAGLGVAFALLGATGGSDSAGEILAKGTALGGGVGAAVGALMKKGNKRLLIYEAK